MKITCWEFHTWLQINFGTTYVIIESKKHHFPDFAGKFVFLPFQVFLLNRNHNKKAIRISIAYRPLENLPKKRGGGGGRGEGGGVLSFQLCPPDVPPGGGGKGVGGGGRGWGRGGSLVPTLSTRCATGGGGVLRGQIQILSKILAGYISLIECVIAFKFSQCVGHTKDYLYAES